MDKRDKYRRREQENRKEKKEGEPKMPEKRCPDCHGLLRYRGPYDGVGTIYWKCRNKECGRTVKQRRDPPKQVIPLVYTDRVRGFHG